MGIKPVVYHWTAGSCWSAMTGLHDGTTKPSHPISHRLVSYLNHTSEEFQNILCSHLVNGDYYQDKIEGPIGCTHVRAQNFPLLS